jgi:putative ABC transport system ATP-binding protein
MKKLNTSTSNAIELENVSFSYPEDSGRPVLNIPYWCIQTSEHVFVHGQSGSGKSTLLNLISGILSPDSGRVSVIGSRLDKMTTKQRDHFRANQIGCVFQRFNLIPYLNSIDNIQLARYLANKFSREPSEQKIEPLLRKLKLGDNEWEKPVSHLSMGQQQRVAIARALINNPQVLIADEPTSSLDESNRDTFMSVLMEMADIHGTTLLFVSHDLSLKTHFNRVESMSDINNAEA